PGGEKVPGRAIVQTYTPDHPAIGALAQRQFLALPRRNLPCGRRCTTPPVGHLALVRLSAPHAETLEQAAQRLGQYLQTTWPTLDVLGPARPRSTGWPIATDNTSS
ncbi:MAG: hypothetical protein HC918_13540, partial [Oscillatoriales cyanobacterium SM2_1_8]|nr:hypothetical protein [Oscillatoriales cyanobacterium SM2_1_8]